MSDLEALRREFSDETSAKCLEAVTKLKSQIDQEQTEKLIELERQLNNIIDEKKRLERSVLKHTETLTTVQSKINDVSRQQMQSKEDDLQKKLAELQKTCQGLENDLQSKIKELDGRMQTQYEKMLTGRIKDVEGDLQRDIKACEDRFESKIQDLKNNMDKDVTQNSIG